MKVYSVAEMHITDRAWINDYVANVTKLVEAWGGRYLARTSNAERLEGERPVPQVFLIVEWPSREAADAFYASEEYRPYLQKRTDGARTQMWIVPGEDVAGAARIA
ncbi:MAG TPA: DUF1330 domain-containing protein [Thermoanaerobaculia bacterium]